LDENITIGQDGAWGGGYGQLFFQGNNHFSNNLSKVYIINLSMPKSNHLARSQNYSMWSFCMMNLLPK